MRKDILNVSAKIARRLHINKVCYRIVKTCIPIKSLAINDPKAYLETIRPDLHSSCVTANHLNTPPQYDLQIVIPVYNVSVWIRECMDSVIHQKTKYSYHIVATNDGSTDNSLAILREYEKYPNITIIDQPNGGISAARNAGLKNIDARYIMFVDSDDCLMENAVELLVSKADELDADIVEGNHVFFQDQKIISVNKRYVDCDDYKAELGGVPWGKVYKTTIWQNLQFPQGCFYEDMINRMLIYPRPLHKATISNVIYRYRKTTKGFTRGNNKNPKRVDALWVLKQMLEDAVQLSIPRENLYNPFLQQCHFAAMRVAILENNMANYAIYKALQQLRETYFGDIRTNSPKEKRIESALLNDDYKEYLLYCFFLY